MSQTTDTPVLDRLLGGTIYDLTVDLATMEPKLDQWQTERYLEYHCLDFLREEIARNQFLQREILFAATDEDLESPSAHEPRMGAIDNLIPLKRGNDKESAVIWSRLIGHCFERFFQQVRQGVLGS